MFIKKKCEERLRHAVKNYNPEKVEAGLVEIIKPFIENACLREKVIDYFCSEISMMEAFSMQKLFACYDAGDRSRESEERFRVMAFTIISRAERNRGELPISQEARALLGKSRVSR